MVRIGVLQHGVLLIIVFLCFLGMNVLQGFGYVMGTDATNALTKIHPLTYCMTGVLVANLLIFDYAMVRHMVAAKSARFYLLSIVLLFAYLFLSGKASAVAYILDTLLMPLLVFAYIRSLPCQVARNAPHYALLFALLNAAVAIVERLLSVNFFPVEADFLGLFRSTALLGHPLNNGLITFVFILFVLVAGIGTARKGIYLLVLLFALVCFGARGSLYTSVAAIFILYVYPVFFSGRAYFTRVNKLAVVALLALATAAMVCLILFTPFGERLTATSFFDEDSAGVRVRVLELIDLSQPSRYLWAKSAEEIDFLTYLFDVDIIENFVFIWILKFGLVFTGVLYAAICVFLFGNHILESRVFAALTILLFFLTAGTNNSLATSTSAISVFVILFTTPTDRYRPVL